MYSNWCRVLTGDAAPKEVLMIDPSEAECAAMRQCLRPFGGAAAEIGFDKPLGHYSEAEALRVIDAIVTGYTEAMAAHHEASRFPPVRGVEPAADPLQQPFADMQDDRPWESDASPSSLHSHSQQGARQP